MKNSRSCADSMVSFQCQGHDSAGISEDIAARLGLRFPDAYLARESMASLALAIKEEKACPCCVLPFCHTVEGEALGAEINYGDLHIGPRGGRAVCQSAEDVLSLSPVDFSKGRIAEVLEACRLLSAQGEDVILNISGPLMILNVLMETENVVRLAMGFSRGEPSALAVFQRLNQELLKYAKQAAGTGIVGISYADPLGGADILGPSLAWNLAESVTLPFLTAADSLLADLPVVFFVCPKLFLLLKKIEGVNWIVLPDLTFGSDFGSNPVSGHEANQIGFKEIYRALPAGRHVAAGACIKDLLKREAAGPFQILAFSRQTKK